MSKFPVHPDQAADYFKTPGLTSYDADKAALAWLDAHRSTSRSKTAEVKGSLSNRLISALREHQQWSLNNGVRPLSNKMEVRQDQRNAKISKNLDGWANLMSDEGFDSEIEKRGIKSGYDRLLSLGFPKDDARNQFRRMLFTKDLTGRRDDVAQTGIAKGMLGLSDFSNEAFLDGAKSWVSKKVEKKQRIETAYQAGIDAYFNEEAFSEGLSAQRELGEEEAKTYLKANQAMRSKFGPIVPLAKSLVDSVKAEGARGLFEEKESVNVNYGAIMNLYKAGRADEFLYVLGQVAEKEAVSIDGFLTRNSKWNARMVENILRSGERFIDNIRTNFNEGSVPEEQTKTERAWTQFQADISNLKDRVAQINPANDFEKVINYTTGTVPYMALAATGAGMGIIATTQAQEMADNARQANPELSWSEAMTFALPAGIVYAGIEKVQLGGYLGKFPLIQRAVDKLSKGGLLRRVGSVAGFEYTQETLQDAVEPFFRDIANQVKAEIPEGDWESFDVLDYDRFLGVLGLSIIGGGGQYIQDRVSLAEQKKILQDRDGLLLSGATEQEAQEIIALANRDPAAAREKFKNDVLSKPKEERKELGDKAAAEIFKEELPEWAESFPLVTRNAEGGLVVKYPGGFEENAGSLDEAQIKVDQWMREESVSNVQAVNDLISDLSERVEGDNEVKKVKRITLQDIANMGQESEQSLKNAVEVFYAQQGLEAPRNIDLSQFYEQGSVTLKRKMAGFSVRIAEGANPLTVAEEFSEGFIRMLEGRGDITFDEVKGLLEEFGEMAGIDMVAGYDKDPNRAVIEGFSKFAKAYMMGGGKLKSLPESNQDWISKAWRFLENPDSVSPKLRAVVDFFVKLLKNVFEVAKAIETLKIDGEGINPDLESLAQRALGLDEEAVMERMMEKAQREIMEDLYDPSEELSEKVKGRLPHPADMVGDPLHGELQGIWDSMSKETRKRRKDGKKVVSDAKARNFFAKKGEGEPLDDLRRSLNEDGFNFVTPGEMLSAIESSLDGDKQYPIGQSEEIGEMGWSFSVGRAQITPDANTRTFPTKDGGLIGPASFSITAYHGTPHKVDRFSTDNIGTGEGAQAYGWGLYFAESEEVAKGYQEKLGAGAFFYKGKPVIEGPERIAVELLWSWSGDKEGALDDAQYYSLEENPREISRIIRGLSFGNIERGGLIYTVNLKVEPDELLDWDRPLSEQSEKVKASILAQQALVEWYEIRDGELNDTRGLGAWSGMAFYKQITENIEGRHGPFKNSSFTHSPSGASITLRDAGIRGIRYLDGNSRGQGEGSYNYVIFDDADIDILEENGKPVDLKETLASSFSITPAQDAVNTFIFEMEESVEMWSDLNLEYESAPTQEMIEDNPETYEGEKSQEDIADELSNILFETEEAVFSAIKKFVEAKGFEVRKSGGNFRSFYFDVSPDPDIELEIENSEEYEMASDALNWKIRFSDHSNTSGLHDSPDVNFNPGDDVSTEFEKFIENLPDLVGILRKGNEALPAKETRLAREGGESSSFSITPAQDAEYLAAVEAGDMEKAQEMVDEAAKKAGWKTEKWYHSTRTGSGISLREEDNFEAFSPNKKSHGYGYFFAKSPRLAKKAARQKGRMISAYLKYDNPAGSPKDPWGTWIDLETGKGWNRDEGNAQSLRGGYFDAVWIRDEAGVSIAVEDSSQIKLADPVTYDKSGKVIPLSQRFNEKDDRITYSITPAEDAQGFDSAIDKLFTGSDQILKTGKKLKKRLAEIQEKHEDRLFGKQFTDADTQEMESINALMQLNAIAGVLPREVRHVVGSPVPLVKMKTKKGRNAEITRRLGKISLALDKHLQKKLREEIRKELDRSGFKVSDSRRRKGKIGKIGHEVVSQIREIMTKTLEEAEASKASLTREFDDIETPSVEDFERWDSKTLAIDLFYDYENATTGRLEQALEFVTTNYKEGRAEWLNTLKQRKAERDQWIAEAVSFMGDKDRVYLEDLTKAEQDSKKLRNRILDASAEWIFSNHHTLARIVENSKDKKAAIDWYNRLLDSRIKGDLDSEKEADAKQQAFFDKVAGVIGVKGVFNTGHEVRKWLYNAKKVRKNKVTTLEGKVTETVSVDKHIVDSILREEVAGNPKDPFSKADRDALAKQWEKFEDLTEKEQNKIRKIKFTRVKAMGERRPVGDLSHAQALQWWLTMRQPDQREKLESMGWDERTMEELEEFIPDDVKEVGLWMSRDLVKDGKVLSDIHANENGIGLNTGENYFPVRNKIVDQPVELDMNDPGAGRTISPGSLKERVTNRARPALADAFGTYFQHVTEMAYWKHNVGWVRQYGGAMRTKAFAENMEGKVGSGAHRNLQKYLISVQNRGINAGREMLAFERFVKGMLSRMSLSVLGLRVSTMWINATAFLNAFASSEVSTVDLMRNMIKMGFDSKGELKATWRNELADMRRRMGASFEAHIAMKSGQAGHFLIQDAEKLAQKGLIPMNQIDVAANTLTMAAIYRTIYEAQLKEGSTEQEARSVADRAVTRAHATLAQPTLNVSRSMAEMSTRKNPFLGIFTLFMSEFRKNTANNFVAWRTAITGKGIVDRGTAARQAAVYTLFYPAVVQVSRALLDLLTSDDKEDEEIEKKLQDPKFWTYAIASDILAPVPLLGDAALSMLAKPLEQQYWDQKTPITRVVNEWKQAERIFDEDNSDSERIDEVIDQFQSLGAIIPGAPILAEAANLSQFAKDVYEKGMGYSFSKEDQIRKHVKEIIANKDEINAKTEDAKERAELISDVIKQYRDEFPEDWPMILKGLEKDEPGKDGKPLYIVSREAMKLVLDER